jgi:hypothetical protein
MKYLKEMAMWSEKGIAYDEIVERLAERSDDECYSAYHWLENTSAKNGLGNMFPDLAFRPGDHTETKLVLSFMEFPDSIPELAKELVAMAVEHHRRESCRKLSRMNR